MIHLCRSLRWKGRHGDLDEHAVVEAYARNEVPWTCLRTSQPWGPDEGVVDPHRCTGARACYAPDPLLVSARS